MQHFCAQKYIGIPFLDRGRTWQGCDCWGLLRLIYQEAFTVFLPDYLDTYTSCFEGEDVASAIQDGAQDWVFIAPGQERPSDAVLLRMRGLPTHVGVVAEKGLMLHVHEGIDAVVEDYRRPAWRDRVMGFYRHKDMIKVGAA